MKNLISIIWRNTIKDNADHQLWCVNQGMDGGPFFLSFIFCTIFPYPLFLFSHYSLFFIIFALFPLRFFCLFLRFIKHLLPIIYSINPMQTLSYLGNTILYVFVYLHTNYKNDINQIFVERKSLGKVATKLNWWEKMIML